MKIGVIGGSGLYQFSKDSGKQHYLETPYGTPSSPYFEHALGGHAVYFLARHGEGHRFLPSEVNYRSNIFGFKTLGVELLISISAVGSLREGIKPGEFVLPEQYLDFTKGKREHTFFGNRVIGHALFADPACATLREHLARTAETLGIKCHTGGTYVCIEGPQFSTRAESHFYRSIQLPQYPTTVIGMTALPEAKLAREAGLCYQTVAMATDYDCWNEREGDVTVEAILEILRRNVDNSRRWIQGLISGPIPSCRSQCRELSRKSVMTPEELWPETQREAFKILLQ